MLLVLILIQSVISLNKYKLISRSVNPLAKLGFVRLSAEAYAPVKNDFNMMYSANLEVGTPPKNYSFILDTGSSFIWIVSDTCDCHNTSTRFNSSSSSSYLSLNTTKELKYGRGYVKGNFSRETFQIGDLQAKNQHFILSFYDRELDNLESEGLLGLGFDKLSEGYSTFIQNLKYQQQIGSAKFSIYLNNLNEPSSESFFTVGDKDEAKATGEKSIININKQYGFWLCKSESIIIDGSVLKNEAYALLDIGTSALYGPDYLVQTFFIFATLGKVCEDSGGWVACKCNKGEYEKYPNFEISIGGNWYVIRPQSYIYYESNLCFLMFQGMRENFWLLGQAFFREYYSVYDMDLAQVDMYKLHNVEGGPRYLAYYIFAGVAVVVFIAIGILIYALCKRSKTEVDYRILN